VSTESNADLKLEEVVPVLPRRQSTETEWDGSPEEAAQRIGLTRRPFFRWIAFGRKHSDPLPCRDPTAVPAWYERMRDRREFKHRCPDSVLSACAPPSTSAPSSPSAAAGTSTGPADPAAPKRFTRPESTQRRSLMFQLEDLEKHIEHLRLRTAGSEDHDEVRRLVSERMSLLDKASLIRARLIEQDKEEGMLMDPAVFRDDMSSIIPPLIQTWQNEGGRAQREFKSELPRQEFIALWKTFVLDFCRGLARSRFAPPLQLTEP